MNKVQELREKAKTYINKIEARIERIQKKCKHPKVERWSDYGGINEQCSVCDKWFR